MIFNKIYILFKILLPPPRSEQGLTYFTWLTEEVQHDFPKSNCWKWKNNCQKWSAYYLKWNAAQKKYVELPLLPTGPGQDTDIVDFCVNSSCRHVSRIAFHKSGCLWITIFLYDVHVAFYCWYCLLGQYIYCCVMKSILFDSCLVW